MIPHPFRIGLVALVLSLAACAPKDTEEAPVAAPATAGLTTPGIRVEQAELREGLPGVEDGVLYLTVTNTGDADIRLLGGTTPVAREIVPMKDHSQHGSLDTTIAPGASLRFSPGRDHLMLVDLKRPPQAGETIPVTLRFDPAGEVTLDVPVNPY